MTKRTVVKYSAPWCAACNSIQPLLESVAAGFNAELVEINIEERPEEAKANEIRSLPTIMLYEDDVLRVKRPGLGSVTRENLIGTFAAAYGSFE